MASPFSRESPTSLCSVNALGLEAIDHRRGLKMTILSTAARMRPLPVAPISRVTTNIVESRAARRRRGRTGTTLSSTACRELACHHSRAPEPAISPAALRRLVVWILRGSCVPAEGVLRLVLGFLGDVVVPVHCKTLSTALAAGAVVCTILETATVNGAIFLERGSCVRSPPGDSFGPCLGVCRNSLARLSTTAVHVRGTVGAPAVVQGLHFTSPDGCVEVTGCVEFRDCLFDNCAVVVRAGDGVAQGPTKVLFQNCTLAAGPRFVWSHCLSVGAQAVATLLGVRVKNLVSGSVTGGRCVVDSSTRLFPNPACPVLPVGQ
jgi:hypothetical protein